ncbi:MAG: CoA transferase [Chloroflexi bacterium]|nr:CoA transferase [Chloroflexota bacterium]MDA1004102.1 CoA transferase [Chloroflexota bacterium]MQC28151.1 CoA transferase [Chloroflexota bacterium]
MASGPLAGVRVLEFSVILAAPFGTMQLADMGADVIKVESPPAGDAARTIGGAALPGNSKFFQVLNRGRRSLAVDLHTPEGRELIHRIVREMDVVYVNYRPGVAKRLGIDYETLAAITPNLIYAEIAGYGFEGPMADRAASDIAASAYGGVVALTDAYEDDGAPRSLHPPISGDQPTGLATALGILAALYHRERTGEGQVVRGSLLRSVMHMTSWLNSLDPAQDPTSRDLVVEAMRRVRAEGGSYDDLIRARTGVRPPQLYFRSYRAGDGGLILGALTPANRDAIRRALELQGRDSDEPGFNPASADGRALLEQREHEIKALLMTRTVAEWMERLEAEGAPASRVNFPEDLIDDPQASLHYVSVEHPLSGTTRQVAPMVDMSRTPTAVQGPAPLLGQHSAEIAREFGYSDDQVAALVRAGVLMTAQ